MTRIVRTALVFKFSASLWLVSWWLLLKLSACPQRIPAGVERFDANSVNSSMKSPVDGSKPGSRCSTTSPICKAWRCCPANAKIFSDLSNPVSVIESPNEEKGIHAGNSTSTSLYAPQSGRSSGANGAPRSVRSSTSGYSGSIASRTSDGWFGYCAIWKDNASGMSNPSGMSGIPGVNMFCVFISNLVSFPWGAFVVPGMGVLVVLLVIPADCKLLVFLPKLEDFFVLSIELFAGVLEIQRWAW